MSTTEQLPDRDTARRGPGNDEVAKFLRQYKIANPRPRTLVAVGVADANGALILGLGLPDLSQAWRIRRVTLTNVATPFTPTTGWALAVSSSLPNVVAALDPRSVVKIGQTADGGALTFTTDAAVCRPGEVLFVATTGAGFANANLIATAVVQQALFDIPEVGS